MCSPSGRRSPVAEESSDAIVFVKEMGVSHADFFRIIPRALGTTDYSRSVTGIVLEDGDKRLEITIGPEGKRTIALLSLPVTTVTLTFSNYNQAELTSALDRFNLYFRRGGG